MKAFETPWQQMILGGLCGILNFIIGYSLKSLELPLFLDQILIVTASFFGWCSGLTSVIIHHILCSAIYFSISLPDLLFSLCSFVTVVTIRLLFKTQETPTPAQLLFASLFLAVVISILGGIIITFITMYLNYIEDNSATTLARLLQHFQISSVPAAILGRIPINLIDKTIAVFAGYGATFVIKELLRIFLSQNLKK
jgi:hypothetical protein